MNIILLNTTKVGSCWWIVLKLYPLLGKLFLKLWLHVLSAPRSFCPDPCEYQMGCVCGQWTTSLLRGSQLWLVRRSKVTHHVVIHLKMTARCFSLCYLIMTKWSKAVQSKIMEPLETADRQEVSQSSLEPLAFLSNSCIECKSSDNARCPFTLCLAKTLSGLELSMCASVSLILGLKGGQLDSCQCYKDM